MLLLCKGQRLEVSRKLRTRLVNRLTIIIAIFMMRMYCLYNGSSIVAGGIGILVLGDCVIKIVRLLQNPEVSFTY